MRKQAKTTFSLSHLHTITSHNHPYTISSEENPVLPCTTLHVNVHKAIM